MIKSLFIFYLVGVSVRAEIQLLGVTSSKTESLFSLRDAATLNLSGWLKLGRNFAGYTLDSYDQDTGVLTLRKSDEVVRLRMRETKIPTAIETEDSVGLPLKEESLVLTAKVEVNRREGWETSTLRVGAPQRDKDRNVWYVVVRSPLPLTDSRLVILAEDGTLKDYGNPAAAKEAPSAPPTSAPPSGK